MPQYEYPRPSLTADIVLQHENRLLLIRRAHAPYEGKWALPGGFVNEGEEPQQAARRELLEETGAQALGFRLIGVFGRAGRDPRGWVVSCAYFGRAQDPTVRGMDDAAEACWFTLDEVDLLDLAFDHRDIIRRAIDQGFI